MAHYTHLLSAASHLSWPRLAPYLPTGAAPRPPTALQWHPSADGRCRSQIDVPADLLATATHLLPSFSARRPWGFRFALDYGQTCTLAPIGPFAGPAPPDAPSGPVKSEIDYFSCSAPLGPATLHLEVDAPLAELRRAPALMTLSLSGPGGQAPTAPTDLPEQISFAVPAKSQMVQAPAVANRICSPTCLSMVLDYYGGATEVMAVAAQAHHADLDLYGVWPANIRAAAHWGLGGYLLRFPNWDAARQLLAQKIPLIASIRYQRGELDGAAAAHTRGHLVVLRGYGPNWVEVNDPAAVGAAAVPRRYPLDQFEAVWLGRGGVGYILFPWPQTPPA